jgi:hypothetical protein
VNIVQILCTRVCKCKNGICSNYSRIGGEENKGEWYGGRVEFKYNIFDISTKTFVDARTYPNPEQ